MTTVCLLLLVDSLPILLSPMLTAQEEWSEAEVEEAVEIATLAANSRQAAEAGDAAAQLLQLPAAHVAAVHQDLAGLDVIEAGKQLDDGRLARARGAHDGQRLAGPDLEGHVGQHGLRRDSTSARRCPIHRTERTGSRG